MKERLRFRPISRLKVTETEEYQKKFQKSASKAIESEKETQLYLELPIYDISLEQAPLSTRFESLNTEVKEVTIKRTISPLFDTPLNRQIIKPTQTPATGLIQVSIPKETPKIADINLSTPKIEQLSSLLNTDIAKTIQMDIAKIESLVSFDLELESKTLLKQNSDLDTELVTTNIESGIETLASSEGQTQLPIFEELINCDRRFPRSFSESFNSPFVVLIGEDEHEWHIPIIYALKELFCEITDKHPRITFREPELFEEGIEEIVDSLDPHSLDQFTFEYKIELLDARKMHLAVDEFVKMVRGRLESGFLQQFGVLVIAVKPKDLNKAKDALKFEGLRVYTCKLDDAKYEIFCSKILGVGSLDEFFSNLRKYEKYLDYTHRRFSIFVKRGADATDKLQYPLKVATFVYLLNDLRNRRKRIINNFEELCEFVNEILERGIKVEAPILEGRVVPDLIYSPEGEEIYVEIETLIGTFEPLKKIDETIEKYKDTPNATIWIVLKPVSAVIHYEELKARKNAYKILYDDKKIDFKVLTLLTSRGKFRWDLVNIDEFVRG
ncbi:hypothetical protein FHEFKHOI_00691 [Candidatus Methanoperedenaceae archaeon GB50]|nr:hypothetical protein FHEFKHOI_00691 [Candidatus Methanoperedenaceae archaeon GB50]CAD7775629.1 MAG: hypothetical protein KBONHNOK_00840 [Candidatus Methanoperedenaceae archaeon GB50]